jgi:hypothetical protein
MSSAWAAGDIANSARIAHSTAKHPQAREASPRNVVIGPSFFEKP